MLQEAEQLLPKVALVYDVVYPEVKGGVQKRIWELGRRLHGMGHEVHVFATQHWEGEETIEREGITLHGVCSPSPLYTRSGRRSIRQGLRYAFWLAWRLRRHRFDVIDVQATTPLACLVSWAAARLGASRLVITWHEVWEDHWLAYLGPLGWVGRLLDRACARLDGTHVAVSGLTARRLKQLGVDDVVIVPNGVDMDRIRKVAPGQPKSDVVYVGRLTKEKNLSLLIEAADRLGDRGIRPTTVIVGDGPLRKTLEAEAASRGLDNVRFLGPLASDEEVIAVMKASKIFVLPSLREGFGLAALEANACGLPVITVEHQGNAATELIDEGVNGRLVEADAAGLADVLVSLIGRESSRRALAAQAIRRAEELDWSSAAHRLQEAYLGRVAAPQPASRPR